MSFRPKTSKCLLHRALSISANIAEGFGSRGTLDKRKFYDYSRGSVFETKNHLIYGNRVKYFTEAEVNALFEKISSVIHNLNKINLSLGKPHLTLSFNLNIPARLPCSIAYRAALQGKQP